mgnify:CR=1 FL=1
MDAQAADALGLVTFTPDDIDWEDEVRLAIEEQNTRLRQLDQLRIEAERLQREGDLGKARQAYEKALAIAPNNAQIQQNYDLFKEINERSAAAKDRP